jgi:hypothetical protein
MSKVIAKFLGEAYLLMENYGMVTILQYPVPKLEY